MQQLLTGAAFIALATGAQAQIAEWVLFGQPGDQVSTPATSSATMVTGLDMARGDGITPTAANNSISGNGWDTLAADDYFTFGFSVDSGAQVDLDELWIATRSSNTGPGFVGLFYSGDGFSAPLATFIQSGTFFTNSIVDLSGLGSLTGTVEFRLYSLNSTSANGGTVGSGGTLRVSEHFDGANFTTVRFTGSVVTDSLGLSYCSGDDTGALCPCGNTGAPGTGCANGSGQGATLSVSGSTSVAAGDLVLTSTNVPASQPGLFFQGTSQVGGGAGLPFGDGLRCAGGEVIRIQVVFSDASGVSTSTLDIAAEGGATAGDTRTYQHWYRDAFTSICGTGFNLSQGLQITWTP